MEGDSVSLTEDSSLTYNLFPAPSTSFTYCYYYTIYTTFTTFTFTSHSCLSHYLHHAQLHTSAFDTCIFLCAFLHLSVICHCQIIAPLHHLFYHQPYLLLILPHLHHLHLHLPSSHCPHYVICISNYTVVCICHSQ